MKPILKGKRVAILVADGFEQIELVEPKKALEEAGAETRIVSRPTVPFRAGSTSTPPTGFPSTLRSMQRAPRSSTRCSCRAASPTPMSCARSREPCGS